jgi:pilus assembly protein CpaB
MKGSRALVLLLLSLVAGVVAMVLAARWLNEQGSGVSGTQVLVATRDVDLGQPLNASMVQLVSWPADSIPGGSFSAAQAIEGRVLRTQLQKGEAVLEAKLAPAGTKGGLSALIGEGQRAITVKVNEVFGVAGFALPGNFVDVLVNTQDDRDRPVSKIVLERILVLAVAQEASRDDTKPRVVNAVTLEVSPQQAERIDLARSVGTLSLVLRNQVDSDQAKTDGVRKAQLLGESTGSPALALAPSSADGPVASPRSRLVRPAAPARATIPKDDDAPVEIIRGVQRSSTHL